MSSKKVSLSTPPQSTSTTDPVLSVFLIRHGERVDEVEPYDDESRRSLKECIDPHLTSLGHQQAADAFSRLIPFWRGKRVAFFVSPMRRTIATAAMIGSCDMTGVEIMSIPSSQRVTSTIPWIVMNGLSDCAANVRYLGGASAAVQLGLIDGAAMPPNQWDPTMASSYTTTPFQNMLSEMQLIQRLPNTIQFFKTNDGQSFIPMSGPIGNSSNDSSTSNRTTPSLVTATTPPAILNDDSFNSTMDKIVKISAAYDCSVCVVVTHREAIREMVRRYHPDPRVRVPTPYCCVGHFSASISNKSTVNWNLHAVLPYEHIGGR
jgi:Histidine phosphatase superfamily (branch 1)